jgi:hypothetical protein
MMLPLLAVLAVAIVSLQNPPGDTLAYTVRAAVPADIAVVDARLAAFATLEGRGRYTSSRQPDGRLAASFRFEGPAPAGFAARLEALLATPGRLEIWGCPSVPTEWLLERARSPWRGRLGGDGTVVVEFDGPVPDAERLRAVLSPPKGADVVVEMWGDSEHRLVATETPAALTRADVAEATVKEDPMSAMPVIVLRFTDHGKAVFGRLTSRCVQRLMPITFDSRAVMVPLVREPITGGVAHITLGPTSADGSAASPGQAASVIAAALVGGTLQGTVGLE